MTIPARLAILQSNTTARNLRRFCPQTGQPDFGKIVFTYVPDQLCVELKSLKLYLQQYRNEGIFYEAVTNKIMDDFLAIVKPRRATVQSQWTPRGGLHSNITVQYGENR